MKFEFTSPHAGGRAWGGWLLTVFLALVLGGCTTVFSAQVSRYQQWPSGTEGARYWLAPDAAQQNNLQFQTYADSVRAALGPTGLVEAADEAQARFIVHVDYSSPRTQIWEMQPMDPYYYGPGPYYRPWGWGYGPVAQAVPVVVYRLTLTVRIDDQTQGGREVFRATAQADSGTNQLGGAMPYLARAVFEQFPGRNGEVIQVRYPVN